MTDRWVNRDAVEWVLYSADVAGDQFAVLITVASFADAEGRGAFPARSLIARLARRSVRQVARDLAALIKGGQLLAGDWHIVMHIRADRRPKVYDLPDPYRIWLSRRVSKSPRKAPRGDISDTNGVTSATERGDKVSPKEVLKTSRKRARDAQPSAASPAAQCQTCGHAHFYDGPCRCPNCGTVLATVAAPYGVEAYIVAGRKYCGNCVPGETS